MGRFARRVALVLLDTRPRWWLSPALWLPVGIAAVIVATALGNRLGNSGSSWTTGLWVVEEDGVYRVSDDPSHHSRISTAQITTSAVFTPRRWTAGASCQISSRPDGLPMDPATRDGILKAVVDHLTARSELHSTLQHAHAEQWFEKAWADMILTGVPTRERPASARILAAYWELEALRWVGIAGMAIALITWFIRGSQVAAYRRMLARHSEGFCPDCGYDVSGAPARPCPECGSDHGARRREALRMLRESDRPQRELATSEGGAR